MYRYGVLVICSFMPVMANNVNNINPAALTAQRTRDPSPELRERSCWSGFWCLGTRKRGKRIVPASRSQGGSASSSRVWVSNGSSSSAPNQITGLSPLLLAPPSSPASFANSANASSVQSPAHFAVSLSVESANSAGMSFDAKAMMFTIGPYAHETALVTPPAFSAFTSAPSTAPFTPPPELVHFTTPPSPDVPFAHLLASSICEKGTAQGSMNSSPTSVMASPTQLASTGVGSRATECSAHRFIASTIYQDGHLSFPTLDLDTTSEIDAAYVASMLLSEASMGYSSPSQNPQPHDQHIFNKGRLSFGFENGLSSLLADQQGDIWYQHSHRRDSQSGYDFFCTESQYELNLPNSIETNDSLTEKAFLRSTLEDHTNRFEKNQSGFEGFLQK